MLRKILFAVIILGLWSSSVYAEKYDIAGFWNIGGDGFVEKAPLRVSLELTGNITLRTASSQEVRESISADLVRKQYPEIPDILSKDLRFLTSYDINLKITTTNLDIKAWNDHVPNGIRIPSPLPEMKPSKEYPYELPIYGYNDGLTYKVTLTSDVSGKVRITGFVDFDIIGKTEINSDCAVWMAGTPKPKLEEETNSGCNTGFSAFMILLVFAGVKKFVRN